MWTLIFYVMLINSFMLILCIMDKAVEKIPALNNFFEKILNNLEDWKMKTLELIPVYDSRKSFYNKAKVLLLNDGTIQLQSYSTIVGEIKNNTYKQLWDGKSQTTTRHINEFKKQFLEE